MGFFFQFVEGHNKKQHASFPPGIQPPYLETVVSGVLPGSMGSYIIMA